MNKKTIKGIIKTAIDKKGRALLNPQGQGGSHHAVDDLLFNINVKITRFGQELYALNKNNMTLEELEFLILNLPNISCNIDLETKIENEHDLTNPEAENERNNL